MAKKKSAAKPTKAASKKTAAKASSKKTMKAAPKSAAKTASKSAKAAPKAAAKVAKSAAPKKAAAKKAAPKKAVGKATAKAKSVGKAAKAPSQKTAPKSASKPTAKVISMDQARKTQKGADFSSLFTPLDDRIVIQRAGVADRTPGGLYIPETVADRPNQGKVVAVGRGHRDKKGRIQPLDVQLGDTVMYSQFAGSEINVNGIDVIVLREEEVLAIMK